MIYKKYILGHSDDQTIVLPYIWSSSQFLAHSSKTPRNFQEESVMSMKSLLEAPTDGGWLPGRPTRWLEGWNVQSHPPTSGMGERLDVESTANDWIKHVYARKLRKNPKAQDLETGEHEATWGEWCPGESMKAPRPFPHTLPYASAHLTVPEL